MPGFVDPHTHLVWAGDRADEFEMRIAGASYMEIMAAGGGIMNTVRHTRAAGPDDLVAQTRLRLDRMLAHGTTTVEIKTGYGLDVEAELKQWQAIRRLTGRDTGHARSHLPGRPRRAGRVPGPRRRVCRSGYSGNAAGHCPGGASRSDCFPEPDA